MEYIWRVKQGDEIIGEYLTQPEAEINCPDGCMIDYGMYERIGDRYRWRSK